MKLQNLKAHTQIAELDGLFCLNFGAARTFYIDDLKKHTSILLTIILNDVYDMFM